MSKKRSMPKKSQILSYWVDKIIARKYWVDIYYEDKTEAENICFACGSLCGSERAHITSVHDGGNDSVENLHLLCKECHIESEFYDGELYWEWFKFKSPENSGSYLRVRNQSNLAIELFKNGKTNILPPWCVDICEKYLGF